MSLKWIIVEYLLSCDHKHVLHIALILELISFFLFVEKARLELAI